ncbi:helix-turn-helix transcriptional regulator [Weissella diestrammenae]|uniref:Helix-turn-helix transcriptional regulator n=1 Tax=Weissella diestrammenae TaxID=1162633 RepID=A0A7G9T659_9LACO|nr:helix-turn-helix transcriptional regulator [Weissella diestrammenae]MCM0582424.1 helix-turn-helix transcriptional regulator [Weissella diestrammenae]QNN75584.1 helix-turn-helix transcriptional regulator [Weissella diestrammenae]
MIIRGNLLRQHREAMGLSQRALADGICHQSLVSRMESENHITSMVILQELCHRLQLNMENIVSFDEPNHNNLSAVRNAINNGDYGTAKNLLKKQCHINRLPQEAKPLYHVLHGKLELNKKNYYGALNDLQNASMAVTALQRSLILEIETVTTEVWLGLHDLAKARFCNEVALSKLRSFIQMKNSNIDHNTIVTIYRQSAQLELANEATESAERFLNQAQRYVSAQTFACEIVKLNFIRGRVHQKDNEIKASCRAYLRAYTAAEELGDTVMMDDIKPYLLAQNVDIFDQ